MKKEIKIIPDIKTIQQDYLKRITKKKPKNIINLHLATPIKPMEKTMKSMPLNHGEMTRLIKAG